MARLRKPLLVANWKLNGSQVMLQEWLNCVKNDLVVQKKAVQTVILPPVIFLSQVSYLLQNSGIAWGGQNMSEYSKGAYTGEISGAMLKEQGCQYVLLGHSERRTYYGETDACVVKKVILALQAGLTPIICLGENEQQDNLEQVEYILTQQLKNYLILGSHVLACVVFAYEPVWAIGVGHSKDPSQIQIIFKKLRDMLANYMGPSLAQKVRILYGGSVQPNNARELFELSDVDGGLVGKASLTPSSFLEIYYAF